MHLEKNININLINDKDIFSDSDIERSSSKDVSYSDSFILNNTDNISICLPIQSLSSSNSSLISENLSSTLSSTSSIKPISNLIRNIKKNNKNNFVEKLEENKRKPKVKSILRNFK